MLMPVRSVPIRALVVLVNLVSCKVHALGKPPARPSYFLDHDARSVL